MNRISFIFIFCLVFIQNTYGQRFSAGGLLGTHAFFQTRLDDNFVIPQNSYYIYYTFNEDKDYQPIFNQYINK